MVLLAELRPVRWVLGGLLAGWLTVVATGSVPAAVLVAVAASVLLGRQPARRGTVLVGAALAVLAVLAVVAVEREQAEYGRLVGGTAAGVPAPR